MKKSLQHIEYIIISIVILLFVTKVQAQSSDPQATDTPPVKEVECKGKNVTYRIWGTSGNEVKFRVDGGAETSGNVTSGKVEFSHTWKHWGRYGVEIQEISPEACSSDWVVLPVYVKELPAVKLKNKTNVTCKGGHDGIIELKLAGGMGGHRFSSTTTGVNLGSSVIVATPFTIEAWVKLDAALDGTTMSIVGQGSLFGLGFSGGKLTFWSSSKKIEADTYSEAEQWHHIAAVNDGANLALYVDGVKVKEEVLASAADFAGTASPNTTIGAYAFSNVDIDPLKGQITDIRFWSDVRTDLEIKQKKNGNFEGKTTPETDDMIAEYYTNNENQKFVKRGSVDVDVSPNDVTFDDNISITWKKDGGVVASLVGLSLDNLEKGTYEFEIASDLGVCTIPAALSIVVEDGPEFEATITPARNVFIINKNYDLQTDKDVYASWLWSMNGHTPTTDFTFDGGVVSNRGVKVKWNTLGDYVLKVKTTNANSCEGTDSRELKVVKPLGLQVETPKHSCIDAKVGSSVDLTFTVSVDNAFAGDQWSFAWELVDEDGNVYPSNKTHEYTLITEKEKSVTFTYPNDFTGGVPPQKFKVRITTIKDKYTYKGVDNENVYENVIATDWSVIQTAPNPSEITH